MILSLIPSLPWWAWTLIAIVVTALLVKTVLGWVFIPASKSGLVEKKWSLKGDLPMGRIIATRGEAGIQADLLPPGLHFFKWWWMYSVKLIDPIVIRNGNIGVIRAKNGNALEAGYILAKTVSDCDNFQDAKKFLSEGGIIGVQRQFIRNGTYRINTALFEISEHQATHVPKGSIGIVTVLDGKAIKNGEIAAQFQKDNRHQKFQDADTFLNNGGERGLQEEILPPGEYYINPEFALVEIQPQVEVPIGHVGVVVNYVGEEPQDTSGVEFKHGIIAGSGQKGVQNVPLNPGKYPLNLKICAIEIVPTTNIVLNWASAKTESHNLDSHLSTITARTKDGFSINLDVSQIINIAHDEAPKVIARFGTLKNLISQVLEPTIGNHFRNSVQEQHALEYITSRKQMQEGAKAHIGNVLKEYNVVGVDTLIGDIIPPEVLMAPIREKHVADQNELMYKQKQKAEVSRKELEKATAEADMQQKVIQSEQEVSIAEMQANAVVKRQEGESKAVAIKAQADANATTVKAKAQAQATTDIGLAEAEVIEKKGTATATAYKEQTGAMGQGNFTAMQIMEALAKSGIAIVPQIVSGGNGGGVESLIGIEVLKTLGAFPKVESKPEEPFSAKEPPVKPTKK